jgi:restriction system protein
MTDYYRVILGAGSTYASEALHEGWIATGWMKNINLSDQLPEENADFRAKYIPIVIESDNLKSKISAGLACSATWTLAKQMQLGDVVLSPNGKGQYQVGHVSGDYYFQEGAELPHRRPVVWLEKLFDKEELSSQLRSSMASMLTVIWLKGYPREIQEAYETELANLLNGQPILDGEAEVLNENLSFVMEKYLEEFLVRNWDKTDLGKQYDLVGSQVQTETGPLDILAQSKDGNTLLVVELKLNRATDGVLGQVQRYMGWVQSQAEPHQSVKGLIIGLEKDGKLKWALSVAPNVAFMRYEMDFRLHTA